MLRAVLLIFAATAMTLLTAGCADPDDTRQVRIGYFPNVTHAQALIGVQRGDWEKEFSQDGIPFSSNTFNAGPSVIEAMMGGNIDIAYIGPSPTLNAHLRTGGELLRVIGGAVDNGVVVVGSKKRGITTVEQIKGARLATPQLGNTQDISARFFVENTLQSKIGRSPNETEVIPIANPDIENLFQKDQLDAAWVPEPWASRLLAQDLVVVIVEEKDLWESGRFTLTNIIVRKSYLERHPDLVERFLRVHISITRELQQDRESLIPTINKQFQRILGREFPVELLRNALARCEFSVRADIKTFERYLYMGQETGMLIRTRLGIDELVDQSIVQKILEQESEE